VRQQELAADSERSQALAATLNSPRQAAAARHGLFHDADMMGAQRRGQLDIDIHNAARDARQAARGARVEPEPEPGPPARAEPEPGPPARAEPEPGPPTRAFGSRFADGFADGWAWLHGRAASLQEDQVIREGGDVPYEIDDAQACTTCFEHKRAVIFKPCGHCLQCNGCWNAWKTTCERRGEIPSCPICRADIATTQPATHKQRTDLLAEKEVWHNGSWRPYTKAGPIYLSNAALAVPGLP